MKAKGAILYLDLSGADLSNAGMWGCNFSGSDLSEAILDEADLSCTTLCRAKLIGTSVQGTNFSQAWVYRSAICDLRGTPRFEDSLSIVHHPQPSRPTSNPRNEPL
jgi:uncharacterized protein YjbI with pentapeptide repeats